MGSLRHPLSFPLSISHHRVRRATARRRSGRPSLPRFWFVGIDGEGSGENVSCAPASWSIPMLPTH
jgi:hypothetical protein